MDAVIDETFLACRAHGIQLNWPSADAYRDHFYGKLVPPTAKHFPSMYYDVKAGKRLEIDALNGAIVRLARAKDLPAPVNDTITRLMKAKEALSFRHSSAT
jgi:2-dehydropantoate 2-reductase